MCDCPEQSTYHSLNKPFFGFLSEPFSGLLIDQFLLEIFLDCLLIFLNLNFERGKVLRRRKSKDATAGTSEPSHTSS